MMGQAHLYAKNYDLARTTVVKAISFNPFDARIYQIGAQCYQAQNNKSMFELWYKASLFRQSKTQQEQQERLSAIQQVYANETGEELDLSKYFR
jgi:predicted Zn-dependent protease